MNIQNTRVNDLLQGQQVPKQTPQTGGGPDFGTILQDRLKVSGHAQTRLSSRNIELEGEQWERVMKGVDKAAEKGAKESLVMVDDVALVVSIKNRTVITAVDKANLKENVFTNIDSAVVV
jgi:flagellar operon protein